jgi:NADPH2:quinone reductase
MTDAKAVLVKTHNGPKDVVISTVSPQRELGPSEIRVKVHAAGLNSADIMAVNGQHQNSPELPFIPGFEFAGEVIEIGSAVNTCQVGDRVFSGADYGAMSTEKVVDYRLCAPIPDKASYETAATVPVAFGTAYAALRYRANLLPNETLLVMGGGGNIGGGALQLGQLFGARVIASAGGEDGAEKLRLLGADDVIDYHKADVAASVRSLTGGNGADVIFDAVTGKAFSNTYSALAKLGRHIFAGAAGGMPPKPDLMPLVVNTNGLLGVDWQHHVVNQPDHVFEALNVISRWWKKGWITPREPDVRKLSDAQQVFEALAVGEIKSKIVFQTQN